MQSLGPFEVERELGRGGSAVVFAARRGDERIALKVAHDPSAEDARRFIEEATKLARVSHPSVVRVLDAGELPDGRAYLAMPLLEGETLASRVARGPLDRQLALDFFGDVAAGVEALHEAGLLHRDIKPENVFLAGDPPKPVLLDLGIAKDAEALPSHTTQRGVIRGTPATMAPERFFGQPASVASDVYELGLLLYVMLVGRAPWSDDADVANRLGAAPPHELNASIPRALSDVVMRALSTRATRRPASARELREAVLDAGREAAPRRVTAAIERTETAEASPPTGRGSPRATPLSAALPQSRRAPPSRVSTFAVAALGTLVGGSLVYGAMRRLGAHDAAPSSPTTQAAPPVIASSPPEEPSADIASTASAAASSSDALAAPASSASTTSAPATTSIPRALAASSAQPLSTDDRKDVEWCRMRRDLHCVEFPSKNCDAMKKLYAVQLKISDAREIPKMNARCKEAYQSEKRGLEQNKAADAAMAKSPSCSALIDRMCAKDVETRIGAGPAGQLCGYYRMNLKYLILDKGDPDEFCKGEIARGDDIIEQQRKDAEAARKRRETTPDTPSDWPHEYIYIPP